MSGMTEISERRANALNFFILSSQPIRGLDFGLSTNGKPLFQDLRFRLTSKIKLQSQQSDSHLSNKTAISAITLQSSYIVVWIWILRSDCWHCRNSASYIYMSNPPYGLRHVARCFILIAEIALWLLRSQSDCGDCTLIAEIAKIRQSSCISSHANCSHFHCHSRHCYCHCSHCVAYTCPTPPHGLRHVARCFILIAEIGLWLLRLQSNCGDCTPNTKIATTFGVV